MTVVSTESRSQYECNGSVTEFPFTFPISQSSDLTVILTKKQTASSITATGQRQHTPILLRYWRTIWK